MPGLYLHIPFCLQKCLYCDFTSFSCGKSDKEQDSYTQALLWEIKLKKELLRQQEWSTVFFGGGTPSLLSNTNLEKILKELSKHIDLEKIVEFSFEVNPKTLSLGKLQAYKELGITRLSVGVQSFSDKELKGIGRIHSSKDAIDTIKMAQSTGFNNISLDLIYGLPHQSIEGLLENIKIAASLNVTHISLYGLQVEEKTPLAKLVASGKITLPTEEKLADMYLGAVVKLKELGYEQYEVSNFAKDEQVSKHNLIYWNYEDYLGLGLSSHSKIDDKRFANTDDLAEYIKKLEQGQIPTAFEENLTEEDMEFEKNMLALRTKKGVPLTEIKDNSALENIIECNLGMIEGDKLSLTPKGFLISNDIINKLF